VQRSVAEVLERAGSGGELEQYLALWPKEALFTYDTLLDVQQRRTGEDLYAARVFAYLREVRDFA